MVKLGWRNPRPNDFQSGDLRPLRDLFGNLQKFLTWPHAGVALSGAVGTSLAPVTHTAINAPLGLNAYDLVRSNTIQVPQDFDSWLAVGAAGMAITAAGTGLYRISWFYNGASTQFISSENTTVSQAIGFSVPLVKPVRKGDTLAVAAAAPAASTVGAGAEAYVFFLPLV
jgi:hypothetical protein